jgi:hypothetical protein
MRKCTLVASAALLLGCTGDATEPATSPPNALPVCAELELAMPDGRCVRPGIPPDACADGFVHDKSYGCTPVLPADACADGLMAVPGDTACRPVMECAAGRWGAIPVDDTAEYVDGSYAGTDSDGSSMKPWISIGDAIAAAAPGAIVAVAQGSYAEDVVISENPVRLWGVCPERVEIVGQSTEAALSILNQAEIHGVSVRGPSFGLLVSGAEDVLVDRVWVREAGFRGVDVESTLGAASVSIEGSLIERSHQIGVYVGGAALTLEASAVRATLPAQNNQYGHGIHVQLSCTADGCDANTRSTASVRSSLVEESHDTGINISGSDVTVEGTVVRRTQPRASDGDVGRGVYFGPSCTVAGGCDPHTRANATLRGSLVEDNRETGVMVLGSDVVVETTVVRTTQPRMLDQTGGRGFSIQPACGEMGLCDPGTRAVATIVSSLVDANHEYGVFVRLRSELAHVRHRARLARLAEPRGRRIRRRRRCARRGHAGERDTNPRARWSFRRWDCALRRAGRFERHHRGVAHRRQRARRRVELRRAHIDRYDLGEVRLFRSRG